MNLPNRLRSSNARLQACGRTPGEVAEWSNAHAWKACVGKLTVGSNPTLSAILRQRGAEASDVPPQGSRAVRPASAKPTAGGPADRYETRAIGQGGDGVVGQRAAESLAASDWSRGLLPS